MMTKVNSIETVVLPREGVCGSFLFLSGMM